MRHIAKEGHCETQRKRDIVRLLERERHSKTPREGET